MTVVALSDRAAIVQHSLCRNVSSLSLFQPSNKNTSFWVVIKNFFKSVLCNHPTTLTHFERS